MGATILHSNDMLYRGGVVAYRWGGIARPGMWAQSIDFPGSAGGHLHMQCVVDDFGNLVPVDIAGMLAGGLFIDYTRH